MNKQSRAMRKLWKNKDYRKKMKEAKSKPTYKKKVSDLLKESWKDDKVRKRKLSKTIKKMWKDPLKRKKLLKKIKLGMKKLWKKRKEEEEKKNKKEKRRKLN